MLDRQIARWQRTALKPYWLAGARQRLASLGLQHENALWTAKSQELYLFCWKTTMEEIRKTRQLSGSEWWLLSDYYGSSNGVLTSFWEPKLTDAGMEVVRRIQQPLLLLAARPGDTLDANITRGRALQLTYESGAVLNVSLWVSYLNGQALPAGRPLKLRWHVRKAAQQADNGAVLCSGSDRVIASAIKDGEPTPVGAAHCALPTLTDRPETYILSARLGNLTANSWRTRAFPRLPDSAPAAGVRVFAAPSLCADTGVIGTVCMSESTGGLRRGVYVVEQLNASLLAAVRSGSTVLLNSGVCHRTTDVVCVGDPTLSSIAPFELGGFQPSSWNDGGATRSVGTLTYPRADSIIGGMAPERFLDEGWYHLLDASRNYVLTNATARVETLIRSIDYFGMPNGGSRNTSLSSPAIYERFARPKALLWQARIGNGTLVVGGFDLGQAPARRVEQSYLLRRLVQHAVGLFGPQ